VVFASVVYKPVLKSFFEMEIPENPFKPEFLEQYAKLTDIKTFTEWSLKPLRRSIRINTLKIPVQDVLNRLSPYFTLTPIPWCETGFFIQGERRDIGNTVEHVLGYFYVQEAASMIPPIVLDPQPGEVILDLCAAPGSKTTQIAQMMQNTGLLVANDLTADRLRALGFNLQRMGVWNTVVTLSHGRNIPPMEFDRILVDAPCSGVGAIRKSYKAIFMWNKDGVRKLASLQKQLLFKAFKHLKVGGTIVYSTCTLEPEENEGVVSALLKQYAEADVLPIDIPITRSPAVLSFVGEDYDPRVRETLRLYPQDNDTEGFYVAKITKKA
jgi:tRNA (cytosine49-C5)-methyltransferase